ncbi:hypothetical protein [Rhodospira trueperi]|uniref:Uncharacterized protein n=1 Tax=Rhodospira trueperi TaxID=69960 RepID=A0A1G7BVT3_9PROT|nr:hypothetical protein [Rhodospira trueperi]SDE30335.1 hypothetical protein SAMN05421720_105169 [Rhodospira trueperi]
MPALPRAAICSTQSISCVQIHPADGSEPQVAVPFQTGTIRQVLVLSGTEVLVFAPNAGLAVYDLTERRVTRRTRFLAPWGTSLVRMDAGRAVTFGLDCISVWRLDTLEQEVAFSSFRRRDGDLWGPVTEADGPVDPDTAPPEGLPLNLGTLAGTGRELVGVFSGHARLGQPDQGIWRIATDPWRATFHAIKDPSFRDRNRNQRRLRWLSPDGRFALRSDYATLPVAGTPKGAPGGRLGGTLRAFGRRGVSKPSDDHGPPRVGLTLELWRIDGGSPVAERSLVVRMLSEADLGWVRQTPAFEGLLPRLHTLGREFQKQPLVLPSDPEALSALEETLAPLRALHGFLDDVLWAPSGDAFWVKFASSDVRGVRLDGHVTPLFRFEHWPHDGTRTQTSWHDKLSLSWRNDNTLALGHPSFGWTLLHVDGIEWAPPEDGGAPDSRATVLVPDTPDTVLPPCDDRLNSEAVERVTKTPIAALPAFTAPAVIETLDALTHRIETDVDSLLWGNDLALTTHLNFDVGGAVWDEERFFRGLIEANLVDAAPALRRLLLAWVRHPEANRLQEAYADDLTGGFGRALQTLMCLDPDSLDVFRLYLKWRDTEHECSAHQVAFPAYLERFGWRDEATIRAGTALMVDLMAGGHRGPSGPWFEPGYWERVSAMMSPERFAALVAEDMATMVDKEITPEEEADGVVDEFTEQVLDALRECLSPDDPFQAAVAQLL